MAEFWMIEPEIAFADLSDNMDYAEAYIKYVVQYCLEHNRADLDFFDKYVRFICVRIFTVLQIEKGLIQRLKNVLHTPFKRLTYTEAVQILIDSKHKFENPVSWGIDLSSGMILLPPVLIQHSRTREVSDRESVPDARNPHGLSQGHQGFLHAIE